MKCPKCEGEEKVTNGFKNGVQRYKCKRWVAKKVYREEKSGKLITER